MKIKLSVGIAMVACMMSQQSASATIFTATQTLSHHFNSLTGNFAYTFDGFDSSLGNLTEVHLSLTLTESLTSQVFNSTGISQLIGSPTKVDASATTTVTGPSILSWPGLTQTLSTAGFSGLVGTGVSNLNSATVSAVTSSTTLVSPPNDLSSFIGSISSVMISVNSAGTQGGSVPGGVFTGNIGNADVDLKLFYGYTATSIPEPSTFLLLGVPLAVFWELRRRQK